MRPLALPVLLAIGCDGASPVRAPPDLEGVVPQLSGGSTPMSDLIGLSYQLPGGTDAASNAVRSFAVHALETAGIHHARADLLWDEVEPSEGARDFSTYRRKVDAYAGAGVTTLPILAYGNPWANAIPSGTMTPPDDPRDFASFADAAVTTFGGELPAYEVWNEENLGFRFWQPREDSDGYGDLLEATSRAIRSVRRSAKVVLGGLSYHGLFSDAESFLEGMYTHDPGVAAAYDVLAVHTYPTYPPRVEPELDDDETGEIAQPRMIARLRALLAYYGDTAARPIWVTEVGWPTYREVDEELQARWLVRSLLLLAGAGVERVYSYTLFDGPNPGDYPPEDAFGLFHYDDPADGVFAPAPKLAWQALSTLLELTGPLAVASDVTDELIGGTPSARAYRLADPAGASARRVTVVWSIDDRAAPSAVTVAVASGSPIEVVDMLGEHLAPSATIPLSGRPVYVIENP